MNHLKSVTTAVTPFIDEVWVSVGAKRVDRADVFIISNLSPNNLVLAPL